jgi:large subunit ribosomal protein L12
MEEMEGKNMEYVYAAMLLHNAGKEINEKNLADVLKAAGINAEPVRLKALVASLVEVDIDDAIKTSPSIVAATVGPTAPAPAPEEKPAKEEKKEEEEKEKEEAAMEGLGALFG